MIQEETVEDQVQQEEPVIVVEGVVGLVSVEESTTNVYNDVDTLEELKEILDKKENDITINITGNIALNEGERLEVWGSNVTINGGDCTLNLNETSAINNKFMIRGAGTTISN